MNTEMHKRALAAREAHLTLLDLKKVLDEATQSTHAAELEAVHLAIRSRPLEETCTSLRDVLERLGEDNQNVGSTHEDVAVRIIYKSLKSNLVGNFQTSLRATGGKLQIGNLTLANYGRVARNSGANRFLIGSTELHHSYAD
jgi:hypothetical protein